MMEYLNKLLDLWVHYPDLIILILGTAVGFLLTTALERYYLPTVTDPDAKRRQQGLTFLFCWGMSVAMSELLWWALDPADSVRIRTVVSVTTGVIGSFFYPALARYLTAKFPIIGSAWNDDKKP